MTGEWYEGAETDEELEMALMETWFTPKNERPEEVKTLDTIRRIMEQRLSDQALKLIRHQANKILSNRETIRKDGNYNG